MISKIFLRPLKRLMIFVSLVFVSCLLAIKIALPTLAQAFPDAHEAPPLEWSGSVFKLSQDYPRKLPDADKQPWKTWDFRTQPKEYLQSVLSYIYEGNIEVDWELQRNSIRKWYHAPWMHTGDRGREFIHGLTRERTSLPRELAPTQKSKFQNWAVGFYNSPGGYIIGQVWANPVSPNPAKAVFPEGTVTAKLLFTNASIEEVPKLKGAFEWQANINQSVADSQNRSPQTVRLLQLDVAVRDKRADSTTGWVFGTFVYDSDAPGKTPWERMLPVGLMWGNDPGVTPEMVQKGTKKLKETWLNPALTLQHYGWAGRLNGPVDNPKSSCLSCHATAQIDVKSTMIPPNGSASQDILRWFNNTKAAQPFDIGQTSTDYSLQLSLGIQNLKKSIPVSSGE
jgi:hypothetical protein